MITCFGEANWVYRYKRVMKTKQIISKGIFKEYEHAVASGLKDVAKQVLLDTIKKNERIYQYRGGFLRDINCIANGEMWVSNAASVNDPYDSAFLINKRSKMRYDHTEKELASKEYLVQLEQDRKSLIKQTEYYIACFSESYTSFPMWGYYADGHKGICIGYNLYNLVLKHDFFPVIYSEKPPSVVDEQNDLLLVLTKSSQWKHEKEWRLVVHKTGVKEKGFRNEFEKPEIVYMGSRFFDVSKDRFNATVSQAEKKYASFQQLLDYRSRGNIYLRDLQIERSKYEFYERKYMSSRF